MPPEKSPFDVAAFESVPSAPRRSRKTIQLLETNLRTPTKEDARRDMRVADKKLERLRAQLSKEPGSESLRAQIDAQEEEKRQLTHLDTYFEDKRRQLEYFKRREEESRTELETLKEDHSLAARIRMAELHEQLGHALKRRAQLELDEAQEMTLNEGRPDAKKISSKRGAITELGSGRSVKAVTEEYFGEPIAERAAMEAEWKPSLLERKLVTYFADGKTSSEVSRFFESEEYREMRKELNEALAGEYETRDFSNGRERRRMISLPEKYAVEMEFARLIQDPDSEARQKHFSEIKTGITELGRYQRSRKTALRIFDFNQKDGSYHHETPAGRREDLLSNMQLTAAEDLVQSSEDVDAQYQAATLESDAMYKEEMKNPDISIARGDGHFDLRRRMKEVIASGEFPRGRMPEILDSRVGKPFMDDVKRRQLPIMNLLLTMRDPALGNFIAEDDEQRADRKRGIRKNGKGLYELKATDKKSKEMNEISALMLEQFTKEHQAEAEAKEALKLFPERRARVRTLEARLREQVQSLAAQGFDLVASREMLGLAVEKRKLLTHELSGEGDVGGEIEKVKAKIPWRVFGYRRKLEERLAQLEGVLKELDSGGHMYVRYDQSIRGLTKGEQQAADRIEQLLEQGKLTLKEYQGAYKQMKELSAKITPAVQFEFIQNATASSNDVREASHRYPGLFKSGMGQFEVDPAYFEAVPELESEIVSSVLFKDAEAYLAQVSKPSKGKKKGKTEDPYQYIDVLLHEEG